MTTKTPKKSSPPPSITESSGNVFADLGLPNPEQEMMKARLTLQIYRIIRERGLTQAQAAKTLGIKQPHVSLLMRNRAGSFSVGRLMEFLTALGQDVEIAVRPSRKEHGEMSVMIGRRPMMSQTCARRRWRRSS
jgi:predicted XRE-type DNA-binding protein